MDWESGEGLCRHALPDAGGCQTRHGKHLKVNNKKKEKKQNLTTFMHQHTSSF